MCACFNCFRFADKTKNNWAERKDFVKFDGKYDLLAMDYTSEVREERSVLHLDFTLMSSIVNQPIEMKVL